MCRRTAFRSSLHPRLFYLGKIHNLNNTPSVLGRENSISPFNLVCIQTFQSLLMFDNLFKPGLRINREYKFIPFIYAIGNGRFNTAHTFGDGKGSKVATLQSKFATIYNKVALLFHRRKPLNDHVKQSICNTFFRTYHQCRFIIPILRFLKNKPCRFQCICRWIVSRKFELSCFFKVFNLRQYSINHIFLDNRKVLLRLLCRSRLCSTFVVKHTSCLILICFCHNLLR